MIEKRDSLFGKTLAELTEITNALGLPKFTAKQIADWLYKKNISQINDMSNLSKVAREKLNNKYALGLTQISKVQESKDGTKKYLYPTLTEKFIESAYIPDKERATLCVSSQVGCKMSCFFCMTGKQGFQGQLSAGEIVNQVKSLPEADNLTNIVYMGMGEPFDNIDNVLKSLEIFTSDWGMGMSPRRITVSSIGIADALERFLDESEAHLAISLHSPFDEERKRLMPVQRTHPIENIIDIIRKYDFSGQRRVSFEYIMFDGVNDSSEHVSALAKLLNGIPCRINLIRFHPIPGSNLTGSNDNKVQAFKEALNSKGILTTIRASRGMDIFAACGMLSTSELVRKKQ